MTKRMCVYTENTHQCWSRKIDCFNAPNRNNNANENKKKGEKTELDRITYKYLGAHLLSIFILSFVFALISFINIKYGIFGCVFRLLIYFEFPSDNSMRLQRMYGFCFSIYVTFDHQDIKIKSPCKEYLQLYIAVYSILCFFLLHSVISTPVVYIWRICSEMVVLVGSPLLQVHNNAASCCAWIVCYVMIVGCKHFWWQCFVYD